MTVLVGTSIREFSRDIPEYRARIITAVPAVLFAAVQPGPGAALWSAAGYLVVNVMVGSVIEPRFMGRGLGLSALVVFLSLVFWGWVLGPVGMFLSVHKSAFRPDATTRSPSL